MFSVKWGSQKRTNKNRAHMILSMIIDDLDQFKLQLISNRPHFFLFVLTFFLLPLLLFLLLVYLMIIHISLATNMKTKYKRDMVLLVSICWSDYIFPLKYTNPCSMFVHRKHEPHDVIYCVVGSKIVSLFERFFGGIFEHLLLFLRYKSHFQSVEVT